MGFAVHLDLRTWVARGVGPVKSEVTSHQGIASSLSSVQVLKSFTRG